MTKSQIRRKGNPEGAIQLQIIHYLKAKGYVVGKTKTKGSQTGKQFYYDIYQFRGFPDLTVFAPALYFIEVKATTGQSQEQKDFQTLCEVAQIPYILARSVNDVIDGGL